MSEEQSSEITINVKGPNELKLQIVIATDKTVLELKQAIAAKSEVDADRQRLIYSGRVLKDEDPLSVYKIQSSHTIHMVKGISRSAGGSSSSGGTTSQPLPTMQTGQNVHDPLTQLNSHLGFGAMAGLNPFADMGLNSNDPNMMQGMMNSPQFMQQMSSLMSNPAILEQVLTMNPQLAAMGPSVRAMLQDEGFRRMVSNPEYLQQMLRMSAMMQEAGVGHGSLGGFGGFGNPAASFPAPGSPTGSTTTSTGSSTSAPGTGTGTGTTPGTTPPPLNPFSLFGAMGGAAGPGAGAGTDAGTPGSTPANPFGFNPALMQQMLGLGAFGGPGAGGLGSFGPGLGATPAQPADTRPPEERFQTQLQQLQEMGLTNASQNVRALLATGGNVQAAIEYIFGGGGL